NYLDDAVERLRQWTSPGQTADDRDDADVLGAALPGLRYVWLRRGDHVRHAVSWWRAGVTGQYALGEGDDPAEAPEFDEEGIRRFVDLVIRSDDGWQRWFESHG